MSDANLGDPVGGVAFSGGTLRTDSPLATSRAVTVGAGSNPATLAGSDLFRPGYQALAGSAGLRYAF